jgi:hypothetical protein
MQRLNIPLHRHTRTTRRSPRRVVWLSMASFLIVFFLITIISTNAWFQRNTVFAAAPDDTVLALHFTPTKQNWEKIRTTLKQTPLISGRTLSIDEISSFVQGEFALFSTESGEFSLAVRSSERLIPQKLLDSYGISYQEVTPNIFLLSKTLTSVGGWVENTDHNYTLPSFSQYKIGELHMLTSEISSISGPIKADQEGITVYLPKLNLSSHNLDLAPASLFAVLSTPFLTNNTDISLTSSVQNIFSAYEVGLFDDFLASFSKNGTVMLKYDENLSYLYTSESQTNEQQLEKLLTLSVALQSPKLSYWELPDGTLASEVIADPSSIIIEEVPISGNLINHIPLEADSDIYYASTEQGSFLTNDKDLLDYHLNDIGEETEMRELPNSLYLNLETFSSIYNQGNHYRKESFASYFLQQFKEILIEENRYSTTMRLQ